MNEQEPFLAEEPSPVTMAMTHTPVHTDPFGIRGSLLTGDPHE
jgi:hypothetical protein